MSTVSQTPPPRADSGRSIADLDMPLARLEADIEQLRQRLPLNDPDRHSLDTAADARFAALVSRPTGQLVEWCTGCNTDHDPDECGYRPETGGAA